MVPALLLKVEMLLVPSEHLDEIKLGGEAGGKSRTFLEKQKTFSRTIRRETGLKRKKEVGGKTAWHEEYG